MASDQFSQYYLIRGGVKKPVCMMDIQTMVGLNTGDEQQAVISNWASANGRSMQSKPEYMEALPSQSIMFKEPTRRNNYNTRQLKPQSTAPFDRFNIRGTNN
jgi:hypothetical protein